MHVVSNEPTQEQMKTACGGPRLAVCGLVTYSGLIERLFSVSGWFGKKGWV